MSNSATWNSEQALTRREKGDVDELTMFLCRFYIVSKAIYTCGEVRELVQVLGNSSMTPDLFGILRLDPQRARVLSHMLISILTWQ